MPKTKTRETLPKKARGRRVITFRQCRWNCRCGRDPAGGPYFLKTWLEGGRRGRACVPWQELAAFFGGTREEQPEQAETGEALPKTAVGSLHLEFKRCGRPKCRCRRGLLHGPYLYRHWRDRGRQRKQYIPINRLSHVSAAMERQWAERARPAEVRHLLKELRHA
jgi:hypothetical protein